MELAHVRGVKLGRQRQAPVISAVERAVGSPQRSSYAASNYAVEHRVVDAASVLGGFVELSQEGRVEGDVDVAEEQQ